MSKLDGVPVSALQRAFEEAEDPKAVKRAMVGLAYKDGVDVETLSDRYGIPQSTVYYWLDRLSGDSLDCALVDDPRPGRRPKLSPSHRATVDGWLASSPREFGLDSDEWSPELLRDSILEVFDVEYSLGHARRILREGTVNYNR